MSGLVLKLGPKERLLVNGAVLENGDRRGRLSVLTPNANILRLKDAIHPSEAKTPVTQIKASVNYHIKSEQPQAFQFDVDGIVGNLISPELVAKEVKVNDLRGKATRLSTVSKP